MTILQATKAKNSSAIIARRVNFCAAHRYEQEAWSVERNRSVFGACYNENGHGHNYVVEAFVEGPIDQVTGMIADVIDIDRILKAIAAPLDHRFLNLDVAEFRDVIPTTENLALYFHRKVATALAEKHPSLRLHKLLLLESDEIWAEVWS